MTRQDAINWLNAQNGKALDYDKMYSVQCVDFFNYYYQFLTGRNPYSDGYGVAGAKDLWNVPTSRFTKIANNPNDPNQYPSAGDILIYGVGQYGHVNVCLGADNKGLTTIGQNENNRNDPTQIITRNWSTIVGSLKLIGWLSFNGFTTSTVNPDQRIVGNNGVNCRDKASTAGNIVKEGEPGEVLTFKGFVIGENVSGNDKWFVGAFSGCYAWSGAFTNPSTAGLPDITPVTIPAPVQPPVEPPYSFEKELDCVTKVVPANSNNLQRGNFPAAPEKAVIHDFGTLGKDTYEGTLAWFQNPKAVVSAHFVISGKNIVQMVSLKDRAYHAGPNGNSFVGIETDPLQDKDTIESARKVLTELKAKYGYQLPLIKHSQIMTTACGDDVDLQKYDITVVPPTIPEPPVVPEKPNPDTPKPTKDEEQDARLSSLETAVKALQELLNKVISWITSWRQ